MGIVTGTGVNKEMSQTFQKDTAPEIDSLIPFGDGVKLSLDLAVWEGRLYGRHK